MHAALLLLAGALAQHDHHNHGSPPASPPASPPSDDTSHSGHAPQKVPHSAQDNICMKYNKEQCVVCAEKEGKCMTEGMAMGAADQCMGRSPCLPCHWTMNMCMHKSDNAGHAGHDAHAGHDMSGGHAMFFVSGEVVTILFESWKTTDGGMYTLALFLCFFGCVVTMFIKRYVDASYKKLALPLRMVLALVYFNLSFAVMLVVMTFNAGVWFACMFGLTAGWAILEYQDGDSNKHDSVNLCH